MKQPTQILLVIVGALILYLFFCKRTRKCEGYKELNADCSFPGIIQHCNMSDGTPGVCMMGGYCIPSLTNSHVPTLSSVGGYTLEPLPGTAALFGGASRCIFPTERANCPLWCKCAAGDPNNRECLGYCNNQFSPVR